MITTNHSFTSFGLTSIIALGSSSSTPLRKRCLVPPYLYHRVGGTSTYRWYSVGRISDLIQDDGGRQESDDEDLRR